MPRHGGTGLSLALIVVGCLAGCHGITYEIYTFQPGEARLAGTAVISVQAEGTSQRVDTAGRLIDRTGNPYRLGIYIDVEGKALVTLQKLELRGLQSGIVIAPSVSTLEGLSESTTLYGGADAVTLPHEDYLVTVHLGITGASGTRQDSVQLTLQKKYEQDHLSFFERLARL